MEIASIRRTVSDSGTRHCDVGSLNTERLMERNWITTILKMSHNVSMNKTSKILLVDFSFGRTGQCSYGKHESNYSTMLIRSWHRIGESGQIRGPCLRLKIISIPRFIATIAPPSIARNAILTQIATRLRQISRRSLTTWT